MEKKLGKRGRPISLSIDERSTRSEADANEHWNWTAGRLIKQEMQRSGWGYPELSAALAAMGIRRSAAVLNRRINRGTFSAGFLLACFTAMGSELALVKARGREPDRRPGEGS